MLADWNEMTEPLQLAVSQAALYRAVQTIAEQAEMLAGEMDQGGLQDRGGPEALRLLAALIRVTSTQAMPTGGNA